MTYDEARARWTAAQVRLQAAHLMLAWAEREAKRVEQRHAMELAAISDEVAQARQEMVKANFAAAEATRDRLAALQEVKEP